MNILFINLYTPQSNNGVCAYQKILSESIKNNSEFKFYEVIANSVTQSQVTVEKRVDGTTILAPFHLTPGGRVSEQDEIFADFLHKLIGDEDTIVHLNWMNHAIFGDLLRRRFGYKVLLTKHCVPWRENVYLNPRLHFMLQETLDKKKAMSVMIREVLREEYTYFNLVDHVITVTEDARSIVRRFYDVPADKVTCIHNGINLLSDDHPEPKSNLRMKYGFDPEERIILYVGGLYVYKGVHELFRMLDLVSSEIEDVRLVVCGQGYFQQMMEAVPAQLKGKITFMGNVNKETLSDMYSLADIGIVPSIEEQCSYVALEIIRSRLPILVSDIPGLREVLHPEAGRFIPVEYTPKGYIMDVDMAVQHILDLLSDSLMASEYAESNLLYLSEHFSAKRMVDETVNIYRYLGIEGLKPTDCRELPMISVVIPCHNAENHLKEALASVLAQEGVEMEVILADDASTDDSIAIAESFNDSRLRIISNDTQRGVAETLNNAINMASGKYVARMDADDVMMPQRLFKQTAFLEDNPDYDVVGCNVMCIDAKGNSLYTVPFPEMNGEIQWHGLVRNPFAHPGVMIRKSIFDSHRYSNRYPYAEDYDLWVRILRDSKGYNLQECLMKYRLSEKSVSCIHSMEQNSSSNSLLLDTFASIGSELSDNEARLLVAMRCNAPRQFWKSHRDDTLRLIGKIIAAGGGDPSDSEKIDLFFTSLILRSA